LGLVGPGSNVLTIGDLDSSFRNTGAGVLVVYDDGRGADLDILDGLDLAYWRLSGDLNAVVPQTFVFAPSDEPRVASIPLQVGSVGDQRPNLTEITVGETVNSFFNLFSSMDGSEWDSVILEVPVPAGETEVTINLLSQSDGSDNNPASMAWVAAGIAIQDLPPVDECGDCDGKVTELTLQYTGDSATFVTVEQKREGVIFEGTVSPDEVFTIFGVDKKGTLGTEITLSTDCDRDDDDCDKDRDGDCDDDDKRRGRGNDDDDCDKDRDGDCDDDDRGDKQCESKIHTSCSEPIGPGAVFGDFLVVSGHSRNGGMLCPVDGSGGGDPDEEDDDADFCDLGKPAALELLYTGDTCAASSHAQDGDSVECEGRLNGQDEVFIIVSDKNNPFHRRARWWFAGDVSIGEEFTVDAASAGANRLKGNTYVFIYDRNDSLIQSVEFHTSCSEPLQPGDQFGAVQLVGFSSEDKATADLVEPLDGELPKMGCGGSGPAGGSFSDLFVVMLTVLTLCFLGRYRYVTQQ